MKPTKGMRKFVCPGCQHEVFALATEVWHPCPKKKGAKGLSGAPTQYKEEE